MDEAEIVGEFREMWQHVGDHLARHSPWAKWPMRLCKVAVFALKGDELVLTRQGLAVALEQLRFIIPCLEVRAGAGAEDDKNVPGLWREERRAPGPRAPRRPIPAPWGFARGPETRVWP